MTAGTERLGNWQKQSSFVNRLLRLTLLASDIIEAILNGRQPKDLQLEHLTQMMPSAWEEQRSALLRGATDPGA